MLYTMLLYEIDIIPTQISVYVTKYMPNKRLLHEISDIIIWYWNILIHNVITCQIRVLCMK
jgi:hypothetical protein